MKSDENRGVVVDAEATVAENQNTEAVAEPENKSAEDAVSKKQNTDWKSKKPTNVIDEIINGITKDIVEMAKWSERKEVGEKMSRLLATIFCINAEDQYSKGLRVDDELYRFNEYEVIPCLQDLVTPSRVVVVDNVSACDLIKHAAFKTNYLPYAPGDFLKAERALSHKIRINPSFSTLTRPDVGLLTEYIGYAVYNKKVTDRNNKSIIFLNGSAFDDEARTKLTEWMSTYVYRFAGQR